MTRSSLICICGWRLAALLIRCGTSFASDDIPVVPAPEAYGLDQVRDVTRLGPEDLPAYYGLLQHAQRVDPGQLRAAGQSFVNERQAATGTPTFPDMLRHPESWRGQPVFLRGHVLETREMPADDNEFGVGVLYEASLFTEDSQQHPVTVVFQQKPSELPLRRELIDGVEVAGYFLKLYVYPSSDQKSRKAPLILAGSVRVRPTPPARPLLPKGVAAGVVLLAGVVLVGGWYWFTQRDQRRARHRQESGDVTPPDWTKLP